ncbi:hypothetical protein ACOMHN_043813 [Nucella lapillus]
MSQPVVTSPQGDSSKELTSEMTRTLEDDVWFYTVGLVCGAVCLVGIAANCLTLMVWSGGQTRRYPCVPYFIALAVYDTLFLAALLCFVSSMEIIRRFSDGSEAFWTFYQPSVIFFPFFMNVVTFGSVYTTACLATDRCLVVVRPLTWPRTCGVKRTVVVLVLVLAWSVLVNIPIAMEGRLSWEYNQEYNQTLLQYVETDYFFSYFHTQVYLLYLFPVVSVIIPVISMFIPNFVLAYKICKRSKSVIGESLPSTAARLRRAAAHNDAQCLTCQVVVISFLTLLSRGLVTMEFVWMATGGFSRVNECPTACIVLTALSNLMLVLNASLNFFCYLYFTRAFRQLFLRRFPCWLTCGQRCKRRETETETETGGSEMTVSAVTMSRTLFSPVRADVSASVQLTKYRCQ